MQILCARFVYRYVVNRNQDFSGITLQKELLLKLFQITVDKLNLIFDWNDALDEWKDQNK